MKKRVILIVLDSFGIGALPDAADFGDANADTLGSISRSACFSVPNLSALGLGSIEGVNCIPKAAAPTGAFGRMAEKSRGKDTTVGHWELMGVTSDKPLPTFPDGFPPALTDALARGFGRGVLCGKPYSGTEVIRDFGEEHLRTGRLIVYTSADSVLQIAAHEDLVPPEDLYRYCLLARDIAVGEWGVGRVIARPFAGEAGSFYRTDRRRDFSLPPTGRTDLEKIAEAGLSVIGVGKISDIFAGRGITESYPTHGNAEGIDLTLRLMRRDFSGLLFLNLVDFDMLWGHRQDADGYARAISYFDSRLPEILSSLTEDDLLIITADHGCDPSDDSTDHTREYVPLLIYGVGVEARDLGTLQGFGFVGDTVCRALGIKK